MRKSAHEEDYIPTREDLLYWKTRAERRETLGTYDNVQSCLIALTTIVKMTKEPCEEEEAYQTLLARIQERAKVTLQALEGKP